MKLNELTIQKVMDTFQFLPSWEERFRYLIDLGRKLPPFPEPLQTEENLVRGCVSRVWMVVKKHEPGNNRIEFIADSDAHIVKGLVALLMIIYSGKTPEEIQRIELESIFRTLELENHLSVNRRNGFFAMVERIKSLAAQTPTSN